MTDKRFTMCHEQNDINGWTMSIVDWETLNDEVKSQSLVIQEYQNRNEELSEEIARQKFSNRMMRYNIQDYEKSIKRLRKSYEKFDEMRLRRIRFLEERLKKNGLSIYVNDAGDVE